MRTQINLVDTGHSIETNGVTLRTQCRPDLETLERLLPPDKTALFRARWEDRNVIFERVAETPPINVVNVQGPPLQEDPTLVITRQVNALAPAKLKTRAAELGAVIPTGASTTTMREIVIHAELEQLTKVAKEE